LRGRYERQEPHQFWRAPATLRKWPSIKNERASNALGTYLLVVAKPVSQQHLYEIHTAPQGELVGAVLTARLIPEIARLRDFL
jgi:hypothetical protein